MPDIDNPVGSVLKGPVDLPPKGRPEPLHVGVGVAIVPRKRVPRLRNELPVLRYDVEALGGVAREPFKHVTCQRSDGSTLSLRFSKGPTELGKNTRNWKQKWD